MLLRKKVIYDKKMADCNNAARTAELNRVKSESRLVCFNRVFLETIQFTLNVTLIEYGL